MFLALFGNFETLLLFLRFETLNFTFVFFPQFFQFSDRGLQIFHFFGGFVFQGRPEMLDFFVFSLDLIPNLELKLLGSCKLTLSEGFELPNFVSLALLFGLGLL